MRVLNRFSRACLPGVKWSTRARRLKKTAHDREPVAIGEVLPHYAADIDDDMVRIRSTSLRLKIGDILEQEEVHLAYRDPDMDTKSYR